jgi:hypothetical protein
MQTRAKVNPVVVEAMARFYGTIEAAREAYRARKRELDGTGRLRGMCLWVSGSGEITLKSAGDVQYTGSADAYRVLPS